MATCSQTSTSTIVQQEDPCNGTHTSTDCVFHTEPITYLFLEDNTNLTAIIEAVSLSLQSNDTRATDLEQENAAQASQISVLQGQVLDIQQAILDIQGRLDICCP